MEGLMRAAMLAAERQVVAIDLEPVPPGPDEVQIEVAYAGICGTDLHIFHGAMADRLATPAVLGHESSGRVALLGSEVDGFSVGDPVNVMPLRWCGSCGACRAGHTHVCQTLKVIGVDLPGAMQQLWTVPAEVVLPVPGHVRLDHAALTEPTAVAVHDVRRSGLRPGEKAVVIGGGPIGLLIACVARQSGAELVVAEPNPYRRAVASSLGLTVIDPYAVDIAEWVDDWTAGIGAAVAFEASASEAGITAAVDALEVRGRLIVVGIHQRPRPVDLNRVFMRELTLHGARVYAREDFEQAVELVAGGAVPADTLISAKVPLSNASDAFVSLETGDDVVKILVDCQA
jgi:(R,R)-butanediol dehydrogenase/meso-butanediol dehydrogenase/diacetyl reductase